NSDAVFMLDPALIEALPVQLEDLYDRSLVKLTAKQVNNITIDNGVQTIELSPDKPYSEEEVRTNLSGWYMHQPYQHVYSMQYDQMEAMLTGIEALEWVDTITENERDLDRKSTRLNSSHVSISYAVFCLKKNNCMFVG